MSKRIDPITIEAVKGTLYPSPYDVPCLGRIKQKLGDEAGLTQFGVNLLTLNPGVWSAQRHWHANEDEFIYVLSGEVVLVTDLGEEILRTGEAAGFKAGDPVGHCLQNRSDQVATLLEVGSRSQAEVVEYPGIDLRFNSSDPHIYSHVDGTPYQGIKRRSL